MATVLNTRDVALQSVVPRLLRTSSIFQSSAAPWTNQATNAGNPDVVALTKTSVPGVLNPAGTASYSFVPTGAGTHSISAAAGVTLPGSTTNFKVAAYAKLLTGSYKIALKTTSKTTGTPLNSLRRGCGSGLTQDNSLDTTNSGYSNISFGISNLADGWVKLTLTGTYTKQAAENQLGFDIEILDASGSSSYTGDGSSGFYVYAPQLYVGSQPNETINDIWLDTDTNVTSVWNGYIWLTPDTAVNQVAGLTYAYQRGASLSSDPGTTTYSFITKSLGSLANGWTATIPAPDGNPLWVCTAAPVDTDGDDIADIDAADWSDAQILAQDGAKSALVQLYRRTATAASPTTYPTASVTYTFAGGGISPTDAGNSWTSTIPASASGGYLWTIKATALGSSTTDTIATGEWSAPMPLSQDGVSGISNWLQLNSYAIKRTIAGVFTPTTLIATGMQSTGTSVSALSAAFQIDTSTNGTSYTNQYTTTGSLETAKTWTITPSTAKFVRVKMFKELAFTNLLDEQIAPMVEEGSAAITVVVQNQSHTFPADTAGAVTSYSNSNIRLNVYEGSTALTFNTSDVGGVSKFYVGSPTVIAGTLSTPGGYSSGAGSTEYVSAVHAGMSSTIGATALIRWPITFRRSDGVLDGATLYAIQSVGKAVTGAAGTNGTNGATGSAGAQATRAYATRYGTSQPTPPNITGGLPPTAGNAPTGTDSGATWYTQAPSGTMSPNYWLFQVDGTVLGGTYTWNNPSYLSTFKVGQLSALSADIGSITAGSIASVSITGTTITGGTVRTAVSGARIELDGTSNLLRGYNSSNVQKFYVDMTYGNLYVDGFSSAGQGAIHALQSGAPPAVKGINNSSSGAGIEGSSSAGIGVYGNTTTGWGVYAKTFGSGPALYVDGAMAITSTSLVTNLNADRVDNYHVVGGGWKDGGGIPIVNPSDGVTEIGKYLDFHAANGSTADYSARLYLAGSTGSVLGNTYFKVQQHDGSGNNVIQTVLAGVDAGTPTGSTITGTTCPTGIGSTNLKWIAVNLNGSKVYIPYVS